PGRACGGRHVGERGVVAGFGGAAGGPEQAVVAVVAVGRQRGDPGGEVAQVRVLSCGQAGGGVPLGFEQAGDLVPVQAAGGVPMVDDPVGLAANLGGRGDDVAAVGAEIQVLTGQLAAALVAAG